VPANPARCLIGIHSFQKLLPKSRTEKFENHASEEKSPRG
jgi:hypothetical protein